MDLMTVGRTHDLVECVQESMKHRLFGRGHILVSDISILGLDTRWINIKVSF